MAVVISAFTVSTTPIGFNRCEWPATSEKAALALARSLSVEHAENPVYPNAFWVADHRDRSLCKFFRGQRFECGNTV